MSTEPVGLAKDLAPQGVMRAQIGQTDLAIWRSVSGVVSAWENRCPHRGMRLSHGFVRGESLACAYHGWHYDCEGTCHYIPAHPELEPPQSITPTIFSVIEQAGLLWVSTIDDVNPLPLPEDLNSVRSITLDTDLDAAINAFLTTSIDNKADAPLKASESSHPQVMLRLSTPETTDAVIVLFQQPDPQKVVAHILANASFSSDKLIALSRWAESVRRYAENTSASRNGKKQSL